MGNVVMEPSIEMAAVPEELPSVKIAVALERGQVRVSVGKITGFLLKN